MSVSSQRLAIAGGRPVRVGPWPTYDKGDVFVHEEDELAVHAALRSRLYFRYDRRPIGETETGQFEAALREWFDVPHALAVSSGTAAIALALMGLDLEPGSQVACPGFAFPATPSAIRMAGLEPVLVEVDDELNFDVEDLRRRAGPRLSAVVVVHMRGMASDVEGVLAAASELGVPVIEDAVPALGVRVGDRQVGTFGAAGAFSTQSDKSINTGEGGFLLTSDPELYTRAVILSGAYEGRHRLHEDVVDNVSYLDLPLYNFRMDELRAAFARAQLRRLPERLLRQRENYASIVDGLHDVPGIAVRHPAVADAWLGECLVFRVPGSGAAWFARALRREGIEARNFGDPGETNVRCFWNWRFLFGTPDVDRIKATLPRTAGLLEEAIDVPLAPTLGPADCEDVVTAIRKVAAGLDSAG
ncbi:MAG TPA: aminotransferase class I/II-fold pyridoxal phosphate-dependent enzyme [Candidatus Dormibacteraeota bacterium]|nr:aminotransferase class I/II-fold pyridoxal phosphate-dependent enzyme [Candidatus Dormibacteraeota bacterium]